MRRAPSATAIPPGMSTVGRRVPSIRYHARPSRGAKYVACADNWAMRTNS